MGSDGDVRDDDGGGSELLDDVGLDVARVCDATRATHVSGKTAIEQIIDVFEGCRLPGVDLLSHLVAAAREEHRVLLRATTPKFHDRLYYRGDKLNGSDHEPDVEDRYECSVGEANLVGSLCANGLHRPVLDVDFGGQFVPSSTPGHYHLYLDIGTTWDVYERLLVVLSEAQVVSSFFLKAARVRGQSFVRLPWVRKTVKEHVGRGS